MNRTSPTLRRLLAVWPAAAVGLASCTATPAPAPVRPVVSALGQSAPGTRPAVEHAVVVDAARDDASRAEAGVVTVGHEIGVDDVGVCRTPGHFGGAACPPSGAVCPAPVAACGPATTALPTARSFTPPTMDYRYPVLPPVADVRPSDEYLCDGGDRFVPSTAGAVEPRVEPQDAGAKYLDGEGVVHFEPSNCVCVYAPRFGEVRTASGPVLGTDLVGPGTAATAAGGVNMTTGLGPDLLRQDLRPDAARVRSRVSGLDADAGAGGLSDTVASTGYLHVTETLRVSARQTEALLERLDSPVLAAKARNAAEWTRADNPVVAVGGEGTGQLFTRVAPQVIVGLENRDKPGELFVCKLADVAVAKPGEEVTFTIRIANRGDEPIAGVRIVDNLVARLEYVPESAAATLPGELDVRPNGEGSSVLTYTLAEPLAGGVEGELTFTTRVR